MSQVDWDERARVGLGLQSVIDPGDSSGLKNALIDRIHWRRIEPWAAKRRSVLDFGCGIGRFATRFAKLGVAYSGVDASAEMIAQARVHAGPGGGRFTHAEGVPLPFAPGQFDGCLTVGVLQCIKTADGAELEATVAELARLLSPGGQLLMIEQASASGRESGSVRESSTEQDYLGALRPWFEVANVRRIRFGTLSLLSTLFFKFGRALPFRERLLSLLASRETSAACAATSARLARIDYYDVAICAVKRAS